MVNKGLMSSDTPEWATPQKLFDELNAEFNFNLDPCATEENAKCSNFITKEQDGLNKVWDGHTVFMNPPYGREISKWMKHAHSTAVRGNIVVCLVPSRTDTNWWWDYCMPYEIRFIKGRLKFNDGKNPAPFPSAIIIMRPKNGEN